MTGATPLLRTSSDQSTVLTGSLDYPQSPKFMRSPRMNSISMESPILEKKRISRKLSRSNSDADLLGGGDGHVNDTGEGLGFVCDNERKRRSHSIDELLVSGGEGEIEVSLETASNKIEAILGNDRKLSKSGGRPLFRSLANLKRREGKLKKPQHQSSEEERHSGNTTPVEPMSCDASPSISRKKAVMKKVRQSLLLNFNHDHTNEETEDNGSNSSGERRSSSPVDEGNTHNRYV